MLPKVGERRLRFLPRCGAQAWAHGVLRAHQAFRKGLRTEPGPRLLPRRPALISHPTRTQHPLPAHPEWNASAQPQRGSLSRQRSEAPACTAAGPRIFTHSLEGSLCVLGICFLICQTGTRNPHLRYLSGRCEDPLDHVSDRCLRTSPWGVSEWRQHWCAWHGLLGMPGHFSRLLPFPADSFLIPGECRSLFTVAQRFGAVTLVSLGGKGRGC